MENVEVTSNAHHGGEKGSFDTKAIWRTFWILLGITCVELVIGMFIAPSFPHDKKIWFNILYIIFTAAKAFYIIAEFMHLRHEIKNMIMTIAVPAMLFLWFIGAFLWEGSSFKDLKNTYDPAYKERSTTPVEQKPAHGEQDVQKPGKFIKQFALNPEEVVSKHYFATKAQRHEVKRS